MITLCMIPVMPPATLLDCLKSQGELRLSPVGGSMLPSIREGRDSLVIRRRDIVRPGDIILTGGADCCYVHRVMDINQNLLILMDDAKVDEVLTCTAQEVLGTVVAIMRGKRRLHPGSGSFLRVMLPLRRLIGKIANH